MKILIVEDDAPLRMLIGRTLRDHGYETTGVASATELRDQLGEGDFQLVVLDIMLPGTDGLEITRWLRTHSGIPIIIISARGQDSDRIRGLEHGADDYLSKPFSQQELIARIRAVMRRVRGEVVAQPPTRTMTFGGWTIDQSRRELQSPDGDEVVVSGAEYDLLVTLAEAAQRVVSRDYLLEQARERMSGSSDRSVDVLVSRLRSKLGAYAGGKDLIKTIRGAGYMFTPEVERR